MILIHLNASKFYAFLKSFSVLYRRVYVMVHACVCVCVCVTIPTDEVLVNFQ